VTIPCGNDVEYDYYNEPEPVPSDDLFVSGVSIATPWRTIMGGTLVAQGVLGTLWFLMG
jgi:hypothetical protein